MGEGAQGARAPFPLSALHAWPTLRRHSARISETMPPNHLLSGSEKSPLRAAENAGRVHRAALELSTQAVHRFNSSVVYTALPKPVVTHSSDVTNTGVLRDSVPRPKENNVLPGPFGPHVLLNSPRFPHY
ncbi:hypothetical protein MRX96_016536 [Rhipicephalus microplus]